MHIGAILRINGILLTLFSLSMLPPALVAWVFQDGSPAPYLITFLVTIALGGILWLGFRSAKRELRIRDGFLVVVSFWVVLCCVSAIPLMLADEPHQTFTDAMFESVSGFTTTGASLVDNVSSLPHAMRYYRQQLQFLGGMGIIVLAIAILPMLGIGGMQLYRMEMPGPLKDSKLTPRITGTAKALWGIYCGLTICCFLAYHFAGLSWFNALGESFATVSTGGFAMHDASFAHYNSPLVELIASVFMFLGAINFTLHFNLLRERSLMSYLRDEEFRQYCIIILVSLAITIFILYQHQTYPDVFTNLVKSIFMVVALATTTGFTSADFANWPGMLPYLLLLLAIVGGCGASTTGGVKVIRMLLIKKQTLREIQRLIHPRAIVAIKFGDQILPETILQTMWGFLAAFVLLFMFFTLAFMACGLDLITAFSTTIACLANAGVGVGKVSANFQILTTTAKWLMILAMLLGRLEIFTLLVLFSPEFWRK